MPKHVHFGIVTFLFYSGFILKYQSVFLFAFNGHCNDQASLGSCLIFHTPSPKTPPIEWLDPTAIEMPDLHVGDQHTIQCRFRVIRKTRVDNVRTPCSCTAVHWPEQTLMAGDTASISIEYDARKPGPYFREIKVWLKDWKSSEKIYLRGMVLD